MYYLFERDDLTNLYAVFTAGVALVIAVLISALPFWNKQKMYFSNILTQGKASDNSKEK